MKHRDTPKHNLIYKNLSKFRKEKKFSYDDLLRELNLLVYHDMYNVLRRDWYGCLCKNKR